MEFPNSYLFSPLLVIKIILSIFTNKREKVKSPTGPVMLYLEMIY